MFKILNYFICNDQNNFVCPQVVSMGADYRWHSSESVRNIAANRPLKISPNLKAFHLDDNTKATDVIWQNDIDTIGLLVSKRFSDSLSGYVIQAHETYRAEVVYREASFAYCWLHMVEELEDRIVFPKSEFFTANANGVDEIVEIRSREEMHEKAWLGLNSTNGPLLARKIAFPPDTPHFDLFCLRLVGHKYFASERLANELTQRQLTGFNLDDTKTTFVFPP